MITPALGISVSIPQRGSRKTLLSLTRYCLSRNSIRWGCKCFCMRDHISRLHRKGRKSLHSFRTLLSPLPSRALVPCRWSRLLRCAESGSLMRLALCPGNVGSSDSTQAQACCVPWARPRLLPPTLRGKARVATAPSCWLPGGRRKEQT